MYVALAMIVRHVLLKLRLWTPLLTMSVRLSVSMSPTIVPRNIPNRVHVVKFIPFLPVSDTEEPRVLNPTGFTNVARLSDKNLAA